MRAAAGARAVHLSQRGPAVRLPATRSPAHPFTSDQREGKAFNLSLSAHATRDGSTALLWLLNDAAAKKAFPLLQHQHSRATLLCGTGGLRARKPSPLSVTDRSCERRRLFCDQRSAC